MFATCHEAERSRIRVHGSTPPESTPPAVSLIVAVYQQPALLQFVLASLEAQTFDFFEVVVADDGSGPEVFEVLERWAARTGRAVRHVWQQNAGFRKTIICNRAVASSRGSYLVFIDGDCILHHRFLERHHDRRRPGQALSGRRVMLDPPLTARLRVEDVTSLFVERPSTWWHHAKAHDRRNGIYLPAAFGWRGLFSARYGILGSNFSLFRSDFLKVNGYDERIVGRGLEDDNLRARLLNSGIVVRSIAQEAIQYHCYHEHSGFPHDAATVVRWRETRETHTPHGVTNPFRSSG
jgi:glycosyltransferase involved in cell wall biosynthesis